MHIILDSSLPKKVFPFALFFSMLGNLEGAGCCRLSDFLNASVSCIDGGMVDGRLVSVMWFNDEADYLIVTQECVAMAIQRSLQAVADQFGIEQPVRMVFGVITRPVTVENERWMR